MYILESNFDLALETINKGIAHTPTLIELYQTKAKILDRQGNLDDAINAELEAKNLDEGDRFLNAQTAKFMIRNGGIDEAHEVMKRWSNND